MHNSSALSPLSFTVTNWYLASSRLASHRNCHLQTTELIAHSNEQLFVRLNWWISEMFCNVCCKLILLLLLYFVSIKTHQLWQAVVSTSIDEFWQAASAHFQNDTPIQLSLSLHYLLTLFALKQQWQVMGCWRHSHCACETVKLFQQETTHFYLFNN